MSMILVCPKCQSKVKLKTPAKGRSVACPKCAGAIPIPPAEDELEDTEAEDAPHMSGSSPTSSSATNKPTPKKPKSNTPLLVVGGVAVTVLLLLGVVLYFVWGRSTPPAPVLAEKQTAAPAGTNAIPAPVVAGNTSANTPAVNTPAAGTPAAPANPLGTVAPATPMPTAQPQVAANTPMPATPKPAVPKPSVPVPTTTTPTTPAAPVETESEGNDDPNGPEVKPLRDSATRAELAPGAPRGTAVSGEMDYTSGQTISIDIELYGQKVQQAIALGNLKLTSATDDQGMPLQVVKGEVADDVRAGMLPLRRLFPAALNRPPEFRLKFSKNPGMKKIGKLEATLQVRYVKSKKELKISNVPALAGKPIKGELAGVVTEIKRSELDKTMTVFEMNMPAKSMLVSGTVTGEKAPELIPKLLPSGDIEYGVVYYNQPIPPTFDIIAEVATEVEDLPLTFTFNSVPLQEASSSSPPKWPELSVQLVSQIEVEQESFNCIAISPDGQTVATTPLGDSKKVELWDATSGKRRAPSMCCGPSGCDFRPMASPWRSAATTRSRSGMSVPRRFAGRTNSTTR